MKLQIYSLKKILYEGEAKSINVKAGHGELTILDMHRPLITLLTAGTVKIGLPGGTAQSIDIASGFLEVKPDSIVTILANK